MGTKMRFEGQNRAAKSSKTTKIKKKPKKNPPKNILAQKGISLGISHS
jgi:hypothetical protein